MEEDAEKEELKGFLDIIPREEVHMEVESLSTKFLIVDWKTCVLTENFMKRVLVTSRPEGYDLMLWGDLHTLFEHDEEDELWKNQHEYNVISWSLYDFCGIHILLMQNGIAIHMLTEKKYPLSQEMISKMLKKKLEVDHESSQAFELLRFIRSQVQKEVEEMFERIISKGRRLEDLIQKKLDDLKDNHKFRGGLLGINLHKT
ncbi:hypothetical protein Tco_1071529 [Tanacetum coccineum]